MARELVHRRQRQAVEETSRLLDVAFKGGTPVVTEVKELTNSELRSKVHEFQNTTQGKLLGMGAGNTCEKDAVEIQPPMLTKDGYSTTPPFCLLLAMDAEELRSIADFKIHRANIGSILGRWSGWCMWI